MLCLALSIILTLRYLSRYDYAFLHLCLRPEVLALLPLLDAVTAEGVVHPIDSNDGNAIQILDSLVSEHRVRPSFVSADSSGTRQSPIKAIQHN
jgi:hypothetical protein